MKLLLVLVLAFGAGCATAPVDAPKRQSRPFYYYHTNYPEHMHGDQSHGAEYREELRREQSREIRRKYKLR